MGASKGPCRSVGIDAEGVKHNCYGANDGQHEHYCGCGLVWGADGKAVSREGGSKESKITITDEAGTSGSVTVDKDNAVTAIRGWYPEAPAKVTEALDRLQVALDRGEYTGDVEAFLGIAISH